MPATLYLICGLPGAGKTTLARQLELTQGAVRLCPDEWIAAILQDHSDRTEMDRLRAIIESQQWALAQRLLELDTSVILENGFWSRSERDAYRERASGLGARVELHFLDVDLDELWARLQRRNAEAPQGSFEVSRDELQLWFTWFERPSAEELGLYANHH